MSMIFEDETAETEAERTRDFSGISSQDPQADARLKSKSASRQRGCGSILI